MIPNGRRFLPAVILTAVFLVPVFADETARLSDSIVLFGNDSPPLVLNSDRGWIPFGSVDWNGPKAAAATPPDGRRWRLRTSYEHDRAGGPVTLQIRLRGVDDAPTFTHPWSEGTDVRAEAYSNWYEDSRSALGGSGRGLLEVRLVAPPRQPLTGRLYSVVLEAWDTSDDGTPNPRPAGPEVQLAYARPLPTARRDTGPVGKAGGDTEDPSPNPQAALDFALTFVESCLIGDLPAYYRAQADPVRSLDDGKAIPKYRLNPPTGIPGIVSLEDYKRRFDYRIYPAETYAELFPEWFDEGRPWTPGPDAWLFMGHRDRFSGSFPEGAGYLVFLVEPDADGGWQVVARPGRPD